MVNPTSIQFARAFKKLFSVNVLQHSKTQNCAYDEDQMLNVMKIPNLNESADESEITLSPPLKILNIPNHDYYSMDLPEENAYI